MPEITAGGDRRQLQNMKTYCICFLPLAPVGWSQVVFHQSHQDTVKPQQHNNQSKMYMDWKHLRSFGQLLALRSPAVLAQIGFDSLHLLLSGLFCASAWTPRILERLHSLNVWLCLQQFIAPLEFTGNTFFTSSDVSPTVFWGFLHFQTNGTTPR